MKHSTSTILLTLLTLCPGAALAQTTLNFDNVASGTAINNQYATSGVTFKCYNGKGPNSCAGNLYAISYATNHSAPNVISLSAAGTATAPLINEQTGYAVVVFANPVSSVSVDALAAVVAEFVDGTAAKNNKPFLQAFGPVNPSTGKNPFLTTAYYAQSLAGLGTARWGSWETLTITRPSNDIGMVVLSSSYTAGSTPIYGIFDNLKFTVLTSKLNVSTTGTGRGKVTSSPTGISTNSTATGNFPVGATVVLTATPDAPIIVRELPTKPSTGPGSKITAKNPVVNSKIPLQTTYTFDGWSGDAGACSPTAATCSIVMDKEKSVSAIFTAHTEPLKIQKAAP